MKVLIADDHVLVRDTIAAFVEASGDIQADTAVNLHEAIDQIRDRGRYDLVLLDYRMPGMGGLSGLDRALAENDGRVALISGNASSDVAKQAVEAGAVGFLPKTMGAKSLLNAIRFMAAGETFVPMEVMQAGDAAEGHPIAKLLTARELEVLRGLCKGLSNKEIAREIGLQEVTVKLHVKTLCRKLEARNRTQAAMIAKDAELF